jgi:hypothetical protein
MLLAGLGAYYATNSLSAFSVANVIGGPLLLIAAGVASSRKISGFSGAQSRRIVIRQGLICAAVLAAAVFANVLAARWTATIDLSTDRQYTLSEQTGLLCSEIEELEAAWRPELLFFIDAFRANDVKLLIDQYTHECGVPTRALVEREAPTYARAILDSYETTVLACRNERCEAVGYPSESNITSALLRLVRTSHPVLYFIVGHGEANLASQAPRGFALLAGALRDEGIDVRAYVGAAREAPPADADLLVLAAPERDSLDAEIAGLDRYLESGGRLLVMLDPEVSSNVEELLERWGFGLPAGVIADRHVSPLIPDSTALSLLVNNYSNWHPITRKLSARNMLLLPSARSVRPVRKPQPQDRLEALVYSSRTAWLETDVATALGNGQIRQDPDEVSGEIPLAAVGRYPRSGAEARIVVIGDRDFASNRLLGALYNRDLLLNSVLWLAQDESHIAIRARGPTPNQDPFTIQQTLGYFYFMAFALPEALLLLGIGAWYRQSR